MNIIIVFLSVVLGITIGAIFSKILEYKIFHKNSISVKRKLTDILKEFWSRNKKDIELKLDEEIKNSIRIFIGDKINGLDGNQTSIEDFIKNTFSIGEEDITMLKGQIVCKISKEVYYQVKAFEIEKILAQRVRQGVRDKAKEKILTSMVVTDSLLDEFELSVKNNLRDYIDNEFKEQAEVKINEKAKEISKKNLGEIYKKTIEFGMVKMISIKGKNKELEKNENLNYDINKLCDIISNFVYSKVAQPMIKSAINEVPGKIDYIIEKMNIGIFKNQFNKFQWIFYLLGAITGLFSSFVSIILNYIL